MKPTRSLCALFIPLCLASAPTIAGTISTVAFEDICADKNTEVVFRVDVGQSTEVFFHKSQYIQLERPLDTHPTTPLFIDALVNAGLSKNCAELLVRETPSVDMRKDRLLASVHFGFDKSSLTPTGKKILSGIIDAIKRGSAPLSLSGHTDSVGSHTYNLTLGLQRAEAVKAYLVEAGSGDTKINTVSRGETNPVATNKTAAGRAENRRVEVANKPTAAKLKITP
ncbi:OmpA family protein [Enterovibrio sp. ZSDZ35]|uniref:OmpA family protein n=1 Tax=Enterovibrio qingdaonensis TaxID=2899818 RepID=A0ABT5QL84_9GAMM|nr:OmpA family protein [Enterovibrio sp. ZSDZ35]MDD1781721.1 OmpA family protein [Enterovibrio sp. ZSDZ35]